MASKNLCSATQTRTQKLTVQYLFILLLLILLETLKIVLLLSSLSLSITLYPSVFMKFDGMYIEPYCELSLETSDEMEKEWIQVNFWKAISTSNSKWKTQTQTSNAFGLAIQAKWSPLQFLRFIRVVFFTSSSRLEEKGLARYEFVNKQQL